MIFSDFKKPCQNVGGILKIWIQNACDVSQDVEQQLTFIKEDNFIVPSEFAEYEFTLTSALLTETEENNRNGKLVKYKLTFDIAKATLQNEIEINKLRKSDKVIVIIQDNNRNYRVFGQKCNPSTVRVAYNSGKSYGNENIYTVEIEIAEIQKPFRLPLPIDPPRPKTNLTVKNTGAKIGFVKLEWETNIKYVSPETQESYYVNPSVEVKITWGIVDLDTGLLDANLINISYPNYAFPSRIDEAEFDGVVEAGNLVPAIPDGNTVKKARSFTFIMPSTDYLAEVKFKEVRVIDVDFENPICTDNAANGTPIITMQDRHLQSSVTLATPSQRATIQNNAAIWEGTASRYKVINFSPFLMKNFFLAGSVNAFNPNTKTGGLGIVSSDIGIEGFGSFNSSISDYLRRGAEDGKFGIYTFSGGTGLPIPDFDYDATFIDENFVWEMKNGATPFLHVKGSTYGYPVGIAFNIMWLGLPMQVGKISNYRTLVTDNLTDDEEVILREKMKTKYNA